MPSAASSSMWCSMAAASRPAQPAMIRFSISTAIRSRPVAEMRSKVSMISSPLLMCLVGGDRRGLSGGGDSVDTEEENGCQQLEGGHNVQPRGGRAGELGRETDRIGRDKAREIADRVDHRDATG